MAVDKGKQMNEKYDFCPKCGALMRDNVCQSCGFQVTTSVPTEGTAPYLATPEKGKNRNGAIVVICVIAVLVAVLVLILGMLAQSAWKRAISDWKENGGFSYEYQVGGEDDGEVYVTPDEEEDDFVREEESEADESLYGFTPDATYYEYLNDYIDYDVDYSFEYQEYISGDEGEYGENVTYAIYYVTLSGENIPNLDALNEQLEYDAKWYVQRGAEMAGDEECDIQTYAYITYNDAEKASIVLSERIMYGEYYENRLYAINLDLKKGKVIPNQDLIVVDEELAADFMERSDRQNGEASLECTKEEVYEYLKDPDSACVFYTPLGMEVGINYPMVDENFIGWVTVTYKDYEVLTNRP